LGPRAGRRVLKRKPLPQPEIGTSHRSVRSLVTTPTELPWTDATGEMELEFQYYEWRKGASISVIIRLSTTCLRMCLLTIG
jgi:hypothetical protein